MIEMLEFITTHLLDEDLHENLSKGRMSKGDVAELLKTEAVSIYEQGHADGKEDAAADGGYVDPTAETMEEISKRIQRTFTVLDKVSNGIIGGHIPAVIVSGASGCGKTYSLEKKFRQAASDGDVSSYTLKRGVMSPINLYKDLYDIRESGVLQLDDADGIFGDIDAFNILKSALDTNKTRVVSWSKESRVLAEDDIPREFEFNGAVIFVTNIDFVRECARETKFSVHFKALMSRCLYVDLGIHTRREVMARIIQVVYGKEFLSENGLSKTLAEEMMIWLHKNMADVREMSIRSIVHLTRLLKTDPDWKDLAGEIMLEKRRK